MTPRIKPFALAAIAATAFLALPATVSNSTQAAPPKPPGLPPIAGCGTIDAIPYTDLNGNPQVCLVWLADRGGTYRFTGIESYNDGDRVFVTGQICTYCTPFCGGGVPILNSTHAPCN